MTKKNAKSRSQKAQAPATAAARMPIPDEPEVLTLWRKVAALRDELVEQIDHWEREDHPIARDRARIAELYGKHGFGEMHIKEGDEMARRQADQFRQSLRRLDREIAVGARNQANERGISVAQLRALLDHQRHEREAVEERAEAAVLEWLRSPADRKEHRLVLQVHARRRSQVASRDHVALSKPDPDEMRGESYLHRRARELLSGLDRMREGEPQWIDLDELAAEARLRRGNGTGGLKAMARRMVRRVLERDWPPEG